jgi:hypothetical protein
MDTRKYSSGFLKPEDVRDGPRQERIIAVIENKKFECLQLELESGNTLSLNMTTTRALQKAYGYESNDWRDHEIELSLGHYKDWKSDPPEEKETIVLRPVSPRRSPSGNGEAKVPSVRTSFDDEIPF